MRREYSDRVLTEVQRQAKYVHRIHLAPVPCPNCNTPINQYQAAGIDPDDDAAALAFDTGSRPDDSYECPVCYAPLALVVVAFSTRPWHWKKRAAPPATA